MEQLKTQNKWTNKTWCPTKSCEHRVRSPWFCLQWNSREAHLNRIIQSVHSISVLENSAWILCGSLGENNTIVIMLVAKKRSVFVAEAELHPATPLPEPPLLTYHRDSVFTLVGGPTRIPWVCLWDDEWRKGIHSAAVRPFALLTRESGSPLWLNRIRALTSQAKWPIKTAHRIFLPAPVKIWLCLALTVSSLCSLFILAVDSSCSWELTSQ